MLNQKVFKKRLKSRFSVIVTIILVMIFLFQIGNLFILPSHHDTYLARGESVSNTLSNGLTEKTITFGAGGGTDTSAKLTIPKSSDIISANFSISGLPNNQDQYPKNVEIDVGDDGDFEWKFNISGGGFLGKQDELIGSMNNRYIVINKGEYNDNVMIRLPSSAQVQQANLDVEGIYHGVPNGDFETGSMLGWRIVTNQYSDTVAVQNNRGGNYNPSSTWGASGYYLMLRSNPFYDSHDDDCNIEVKSDLFPKFNTDYITMDWDLVEHDRFSLFIYIEDNNNNQVLARFLGGNSDNNNNNYESLTKQVIDISTLTGTDLNFKLQLIDGSLDWPWNEDDWGRIAVDNIYISDNIGTRKPNYPANISIDFGDDGTKEFTETYLNGVEGVNNLKNILNGLLSNPSPACRKTIDKYGNEFLDIPLNISVLSSPGIINLSNLEIVYDYKAEVNINPRGTLTEELDDSIPSTGQGNVTIPIMIRSSTPGKIKISNINIKYNELPRMKPLTSIDIEEDSMNPKLYDLTDYFNDDSSKPLKFEIASNSAPDKLEVLIEEDKYLSINANQETNWHGIATIIIRAIDNLGLSLETNPILINVLPVNDEPIPNVPIPNISLFEDSLGTKIPLDDVSYFIDVENEPLYYDIKLDPMNTIPDLGTNLYVSIDPKNNLVIIPAKNWHATNIPVWLFCDDDKNPLSTESSSPHHKFFVDVKSVNDPPVIEPIGTIYMDEDISVDNILALPDKVSDIETLDKDLKFEILTNDNEDNIEVKIDMDNNLDISILTQDYVGTAKIKLQVEDSDGATATDIFKIVINAINDGPRIFNYLNEIQMTEDTIDSSSMNLYDVFYDPDSPISFSFVGNQHVGVTISHDHGTVVFKPEKNWYGTENIVFTATDTYIDSTGNREQVNLIVKTIVTPINDPPNQPRIISPQVPRANPARHSIDFKAADAIDVDSDVIFYYWDIDNRVDNDGDGDPTNDKDGIGQEFQFEYPTSGYYYVTLTTSDGKLNCSQPTTVYIKVTTNIEKINEELGKGESTIHTEIFLTIPFIIIIILLFIWLIILRKKEKKTEKKEPLNMLEKVMQDLADVKPDSQVPILEGELISEPKLPSTATPVETNKPPQFKKYPNQTMVNKPQNIQQPRPQPIQIPKPVQQSVQPPNSQPSPQQHPQQQPNIQQKTQYQN